MVAYSICERKPASYFSCVRIGNESSKDGLTLHPPQFSICLGAPHGIASVGCRTHSFLSISYQYVLYAHAQGVFIDIIVLADWAMPEGKPKYLAAKKFMLMLKKGYRAKWRRLWYSWCHSSGNGLLILVMSLFWLRHGQNGSSASALQTATPFWFWKCVLNGQIDIAPPPLETPHGKLYILKRPMNLIYYNIRAATRFWKCIIFIFGRRIACPTIQAALPPIGCFLR